MRPRNGNTIPTAKDGYPEFPQVSSRAELRKTICELKGKATAREIMNAYGLQSRNVVIGIWGRARRSSNGAAA